MAKFIAENPATKRVLLGLLGAGLIAFNKKLGLNLGVEDLGMITVLLTSMIAGSNWKEAKIAGAEAAAKVVTPADALAVINKPGAAP